MRLRAGYRSSGPRSRAAGPVLLQRVVAASRDARVTCRSGSSSAYSRAPPGRVPERTQQQRHVVVPGHIANVERDLGLWKKRHVDTLAAMIRTDVERQPVDARCQLATFGQRVEAAVLLGDAAGHRAPPGGLAQLP